MQMKCSKYFPGTKTSGRVQKARFQMQRATQLEQEESWRLTPGSCLSKGFGNGTQWDGLGRRSRKNLAAHPVPLTVCLVIAAHLALTSKA
jgi:hypothetical protein